MEHFPKRLTIDWLKANYEDGTVTPLRVAECIVKRAKSHQEKNIWIEPPVLENMKKYIDNLPEDKENYPLWGIPFAIKDNIDLEQVTTTAACKAYSYVPEESATVVKKLIAAGAIPVGKTNLDQFATGLVGTRSPYGEVHNALNPELISGGSSSGSAVAVALGLAAFSLGTDTAGSGRVPAALNCLVGYKPAVGAWSSKGVVPACQSLDCVTVFANNLDDVQSVNLVARGFDEECCWSRDIPAPDYKKPEKILLAKDGVTFYGPFKDVYEKKWNRAVERLKHCGIPIEYIDYSMFQEAASILYDGPWVAERWKDLGDFVEAHAGEVFPVTETILCSGKKGEHTASSVFTAMHKLQKYKAKAKKLLESAVLIMPTAGGTFTREEVRNNPIATNSQMGLYTNHCNLLDLSAIAIPEKAADTELPFGITCFARSDSESLLLGMADKFLKEETTTLAVCGLHKKGMALEYQLSEKKARFTEHTKTAAKYKLFSLRLNPAKPGMYCTKEGGNAIEVDLYEVPLSAMGYFMEQVPKPLVIGTVELEDGRMVKGFLCEEYSTKNAKDITAQGTFKMN